MLIEGKNMTLGIEWLVLQVVVYCLQKKIKNGTQI